MSDKHIIVNDVEGVARLREYLKGKELAAVDTETTGVTRSDSVIGYSICAEDNIAWYVATNWWDKDEQTLKEFEGVREASKGVFEDLKGKAIIGHNILFDCLMVENNYGVSLIESVFADSMLMSQLIDENRRHGLKELAADIWGEDATEEQRKMKDSVTENGGVLTKKAFQLYRGDWDLIAEYGAKDALLTYRLFHYLWPILEEEKMVEFFMEESMPLLRGPTYHLNSNGLKVDIDKLTTLKKELEVEAAQLVEFVDREIVSLIQDKYPGTNKKNTFNIDSREQMAWLLFEKMGNQFVKVSNTGADLCKALDFKRPYSYKAKAEFIRMVTRLKGEVWREKGTWDPKKRKKLGQAKVKDYWCYLSVDKSVLLTFAKEYQWVEKLLELRKVDKLLGTYVEPILRQQQYGVIYPQYLQHGTTSGRYSCIAEGSMISMPGGDKPIEQVVPGDLVYCFTDDGKPTVSRVTNTFDNGIQDCVKITWKSQGSHRKGTLICTPDHKLKCRTGEWKPAEELKKDERIYHLRRAVNPVNERARIYGLNHKIISVLPEGKRHVFDLEVEGHHNFIANELCVHNCKAPNFQNLPRDEKRLSKCFIPRPGEVFVASDASQLEPRIFASYSQDERLMGCFSSGQDFYSIIGATVFGVTGCNLVKDDNDPNFFGNKYKDYRQVSKTISLSATYGTTAFKMAPLLGKSTEEAQEIITNYFTQFPKVKEMMTRSHNQAKSQGYVENLFGRKRRLPEALKINRIYGKDTEHKDLPYEARNVLNLSVNHPVQSTGASIMNRSAIRFLELCKNNGIKVKIVMQVHDSLVIQCAKENANDVALLLQESMENTVTLPGVKLEAIPKIGTDLSQVK